MNDTPITAQQVERLSKLLAEADECFEDGERSMAFARLGEVRRILAPILAPRLKGSLAGSSDDEVDRLRGALEKIAKRWPCDNADTMAQVAKDALGSPTGAA